MRLQITHFTDPACPFAFSAEPIRWRIRWAWGDQIDWQTRLINLTLEPGEAEKLAEGAPALQRRHGMPIDPSPRARPASSEPACRAIIAARLHAPDAEEALLRRIRILGMAGGLLDDPALVAAAATEAGLDPERLGVWAADDRVKEQLERDERASRSPSDAARALDDKLGGPSSERRYSAPSYEISEPATGRSMAVPGFNAFAVYEIAIVNLAPGLARRTAPSEVRELLRWAGEPLATAEVAEVMEVERDRARLELGRVAVEIPTGADSFWRLP